MEVFVVIGILICLIIIVYVGVFGHKGRDQEMPIIEQETPQVTEQEQPQDIKQKFWNYCFCSSPTLKNTLCLNPHYNYHQQMLLYLVLSYKRTELYPIGHWNRFERGRYERHAEEQELICKHIITPAKYDTVGFLIESENWKWVLSPKGEEFVQTYMAEFTQIFNESQK
jgi:hypothetical protein